MFRPGTQTNKQSATGCFESLNQMKPKNLFFREWQIVYCKIFLQCLHNGLCCQNSWKMHHFTSLFLFKENSSSNGGLQVSEDEGTVLSVQEDDPDKEGDADSFGLSDHTTKLLDEAPPKSALKHAPVRRQPSLTRGQYCKETNEHKSTIKLMHRFDGTVKPRLSGLVGTSVNSPDNRESG